MLGFLPEADQSGAYFVGVGVVEVVEDGQGLVPGFAGGGVVSSGVMGVGEAAEGFGLLVAVAEFVEAGPGPAGSR